MFLDVKWGHPFEQTWMSYIYQKTRENLIKPGLLLLSPIEHHRFEHYAKELRKENRENRCKNFNTPIDEGIKQSFKLVKFKNN